MIDAHVHIWRIGQNDCHWPGPDLPMIHRDFDITDLDREMTAHGVDGAIMVQSQESEVDTLWLLEQAAQHQEISGVVGWVDLSATNAGARIDRLRQVGPLVGIRPMMQGRADDCYDDAALRAGIAALAERDLVLDALVFPRHLPSLLRLAQRLPALTIVIDHGAKPALGSGPLNTWAADMRALADCPNVACKLSGLLTELAPGAPIDAVHDAIAILIEAFGPDRLIWGSDWPVVTLASPYTAWLNLARRSVPEADRAAIFGDNAARIYRTGVYA